MMRILLFLLPLLVWPAVTANAQANQSGGKPQQPSPAAGEPTLADTMSFLENFFAAHGCAEPLNADGTAQYCTVFHGTSGCHIEVYQTFDGVLHGSVHKLNLTEFDPDSVKLQAPSDISPHMHVIQVLRTTDSTIFGLQVSDLEAAKHGMNALTHGIKLCGGKAPVF